MLRPDLFRYPPPDQPELKTVGRFIAQLATGRASKRPFGRSVSSVVEAFDPEAFHFGKIQSDERLFYCENDCGDGADLKEEDEASSLASGSATVVLLNVSPILRYHFLLVPRLGVFLPQVLSLNGLEIALSFLAENDARLKLLYNSLGGAASVNHLHFQGFYLPVAGMPPELPLELQEVAWHSDTVGEIPSWPLHAIVVSSADLQLLAAQSFGLVKQLTEANIAHHMLLTKRSGVLYVFIVARVLQASFDSRFINVAVNEAVGWFICPDEQEFNELDDLKAGDLLRLWRLPADDWSSLHIFDASPRSMGGEL